MRYLWVTLLLLFLLPAYGVSAGETEPLTYTGYLAANGQPQQSSQTVEPITINAAENGDYLQVEDDAVLEYIVEIPVTGYYNISLKYAAVTGGSQIVRSVLIDGEAPFKECLAITLRRYYTDANRDYKTQKGNQDFPPQVEVQRFTTAVLQSTDGYHSEPFAFYLTAGTHTVSIVSVDAAILLETFTLSPYKATPSYAEYDANNRALGYMQAEFGPLKIQAEDAVFKSSPGLYPINDRTSPKTEPYHPTYVTLNTIGGSTWRDPGTMLEWNVIAPDNGLYAIALKTKQAETRGAFSSRSLRVNGEVPFSEAAALRFDYSTDFKSNYISDTNGEPYLFYLNKGENTLSLEATLGVFASLTERVGEMLRRNNQIYQDVAVFTGSTPDKYRDYNLYNLIPDTGIFLGVKTTVA
jgi:hypothetical protein